MATTQQPLSASGPQASHAAQLAAQQPVQQPPAQQQQQAKKKRFGRNPFRRKGKAERGGDLAKGRADLIAHGVITDPAAQQAAQQGAQQGAQQAAQPAQPTKHAAQPPTAASADPTSAGAASDFAENFTVFSDPIDSVGGAIGDTGTYIGIRADYEDATPGHATEKDEDQMDAAGEYQATVLGTASSGIGAFTSGVSAISGGAAMGDNIYQFVKMVQARRNGDAISGLQLADTGLQGVGNGVQMVTSGLTGAAALGGVGAGIASAQDASNDVAATAAAAFGGLGDAIGAVGGSVQLLVSGSRLVIGVINNVRNPDAADWTATATDSIGMLKGFLSTASSTVSAVSAFLSIAGHAAELANALPVVGAAVNICIQLLDIVIQTINFVKSLIKMIGAIKQSRAMKNKSEAATDGDEQEMLGQLSEINSKRYKRQLIPLISSVVNGFADCISIGGSVLNVVGTATAPAYGAGVAIMAAGYGASATAGLVKLGTALAGPVARLVRTQKQFGRDVAAGDKTGKMAGLFEKTHLSSLYNKNKSTREKDSKYLKSVNTIYDMVAALPATYTDQDADKFEHVHEVIKATGVRTKQLYATADQEEATRLLMDALKKRD